MEGFRETIVALQEKLPPLRECLDVPAKELRREELRQKSVSPDLWNDPAAAAATLRELESIERELGALDRIGRELRDLEELSVIEGLGPEEEKDMVSQAESLSRELEEWEFKLLFSGPHDRGDALLSVHAGAGGVDAQDWAEMLLRMYLRYAERAGFDAVVIDESRGTEAGVKSATIEIRGEFAYGYLRTEAGVHRLVRLSPFNADRLRQTSFALVEVLPVLSDTGAVEVKPEELRIDTYRASGAGGQHVNKTESAVRVTHLPTGVVASSQSERSQLQNREQAMKLLRAKLYQRAIEERVRETKELKGEHKSAEWGNQIRSYVLHPYNLVKDHRTKEETADTAGVLDGKIETFIERALRYRSSEER
ncbi:MAG: peptide chain release factor 2 [Candidatus Moranbacteria bacterium]|nr:peptide chain release factor 2 [Candidatus Moranbacteria bacterium]NTW45701.1 peptide chain release factor 2 [Candidatus Moranbacteria bacterium]